MGYGSSSFGFEDLEVYQVARRFRHDVYFLAKGLPADEKYALAQQMKRAAISVTSNIAEGYGRYNWQESIQFFRHSRGSLVELVDQIGACEDEGYSTAVVVEQLRTKANSVLRLINGYIKYLKQQKTKKEVKQK
ncbi:MAG: four helix bundle protein [Phycisphaerae bacterium]|nr:four helix bundle protein [Phycisphaerae bacterium]